MNRQKIFIVAGEDSGDLHGSKLIISLKKLNPNIDLYGIGGSRMEKEGLKLTEHIKNLNVIGIFEVLRHYRKIKAIFNNTIKEIKRINPDKIILIDYPGFNLRLAKKLKHLGFDVRYFILPQVWAWKESRAKVLKDTCNKLISIIPFEKDWFLKRGISVSYVGHPLGDLSKKSFDKNIFLKENNIPEGNKIIALLPGSRKVEVDRHWKIFEGTVKKLNKKRNDLTFVLIEGDNVSFNTDPRIIRMNKGRYNAIFCADAAIVCSGTATLETAMLNCPMIVCYKLSAATWFLAKMMSKVKYLSLVNLIAGREIVEEYLQENMKETNLVSGVLGLLDKDNSERIKEDYQILINKLKTNSNPYLEAAKIIYD